MFSSLKQTFLLLAVLMLLAGCALFKPESAPPGPEPSAEAGREIQGNAYYYYIRSHMAQKAGNLEQAISFLEKTLDAGKEELFLKKELIYLYLQNQEDQKALAESENILEDHPEDVEALIIAATIKQHQNYPSEAAGLLE